MPSTYTTDLAIQLMATGENAGTWGQITNTNLVVIQQAIAGYQSISIAGGAQTTALLMTQNAVSTARNAVIKLTGTITGNQIVTVPNGIEKTWIVSNGTTGAFTVQFKYASTGTGQTWSTTDKGIKILYSDGTDIQVVDLSTLSGTVATAKIADFAVTTAKLDTNAVTAVKITQSTITQAKLAANSVGANQIVQSTITQSKLAANSVGANQLIATAVTAGTYTAATITVDADGRITAASSGSGGAGMAIPVIADTGPASGTYTKNNAANRIAVYMCAGGGGYGVNATGNGTSPGGDGGSGFYNFPTTGPFSQPYSVGGGGSQPSGPASSGSAGGNTTLANVGTVNAGNGAGANTPGNAGTQPGASLAFPTSSYFRGGFANFNFGICGAAIGIGLRAGFGKGGTANPGNSCGRGGVSGTPGYLIIYENTGT